MQYWASRNRPYTSENRETQRPINYKNFMGMEEKDESLFSNTREENGVKVLDICDSMDKFELLSLLFHRETVKVEALGEISVTKNDKKRYFEDSTICYNCGEIGHVSRNCGVEKERNCMYCDINHKGKPCDFVLCDNCLNLGHNSRNCRSRPRQLRICKKCPLQSHYDDECPRVWRKYRLKSTSKSSSLIMSCPYCYSDSHFMDDCSMKDRKFTIFTKHYLKVLEPLKGSRDVA